MKSHTVALLLAVPAAATHGKNTIAGGSGDAMVNLEFMLRYLPVTVAEDNGVGNVADLPSGHTANQARVQALLNNSYTAPNCQLYSSASPMSPSTSSESMVANGLGQSCSYTSGVSYGEDNKLWKVYTYNSLQCCNACVATADCAAATFHSSDLDQSGGDGPQTWEGFGLHLPDVTTSLTTGGIEIAELQKNYETRLADFVKFDAFMDYSVTFFVYDLKHYVDLFERDNIAHFRGMWKDGGGERWWSVIFKIPQSTYIIELVSLGMPGPGSYIDIEQRMSDAHCDKFRAFGDHPAKVLHVSSINRAAANLDAVLDVYTNIFKAHATLDVTNDGVKKHCFSFMQHDGLEQPPARPSLIDVDVCYTSREANKAKDAVFSVADHEAMLWSAHAAVLSSDPASTNDKYTDSHFALPMPTDGLAALAANFSASNPYPISGATRLAYACQQNYIIEPTGLSIQPEGPANWPGCSSQTVV